MTTLITKNMIVKILKKILVKKSRLELFIKNLPRKNKHIIRKTLEWMS